MPANETQAVGDGLQLVNEKDFDANISSEWLSSDDRHPEEATRFLDPEQEEGKDGDVEAAADHHPASEASPSELDAREPFDPILWSARKRWTHILVVAFITCVTPLASAVYTPALDQVIRDFSIEDNPSLAHLTVSAYVLGFSAGPLLIAPLSEVLGKKPVYQFSNVLLLVCNLGCMVAPSAEWLVFFRFVAGCAGASPITQGSGTATDVMKKHERARALSVMAFGSVCSPAVGSALGGGIAQVWGWRGCFGFLVFMCSISVVLTQCLMCETHLPVLRRKFAAMGIVGDVNGEKDIITEAPKPMRTLLYKAAIRPLALAFEPSILPAIIVTSFFYGLQVWLYIDVPMTYKEVYGFNTAEAGLAFAGMGVGMFTGLLIFGFLSDVVVSRLARGGERLPGHRLPLLNAAAILVVAGMIIYNTTARSSVSYLVPLLGEYLIGCGLFAITMTTAVYIIDLSPQHAVATGAAIALLRYPSGALFPLAEHALESFTSNSSAKWFITAAAASTVPLVVWLQFNCENSTNDADAVATTESYELADYNPITARKTAEDREAQREQKRIWKRRWLEEQDDMKFSHSIQFNAVPDWSSHYIAYSNLKKLIYQLEKTVHQTSGGDAESRPLIRNEEPEEVFSRALGVELEKICSFYVAKEGELLDDVNQLLGDVGNFSSEEEENGEPRRSFGSGSRPGMSGTNGARSESIDGNMDDSDDDEEDDETTGLTKSRSSLGGGARRKTAPNLGHSATELTASTELTLGRSLRRYSTAQDEMPDQSFLYSSSIMLKKRIISLYVQLCELKSYVQLNRTGFRKVLKKFDKILDKELRPKYMSANVDSAYPFKVESIKTIEENISKIEKAYAEIVTQGDENLAKRDLRSHLREHVVWERNTVWRDMIGMERRAEAASLGRTLLGRDGMSGSRRLQGDDELAPITKEVVTPMGRFVVPTWVASTPLLTLLIAITVFMLLLFIPIMEKPEQQNCLALIVFVSILWATEAIPLFVTSLMIPFLCVVLNVVRAEDKPHRRLDSKAATSYIFSAMWTPVIMLLLGGFTLAAALSKCKIDKRLATFVLSKAGTTPRTVLIANMLVAAFASMLISNVAAPVLCFSIIEPMLRTLPSESNMSKAVIMGIALASNIGGMLSPIASPQNVVAIGIMKPAPTWIQWFFIVIPVGIVSLLLIWVLLLITFQPSKGTTIAPIRPVKEKFSGIQWFVSLVTIATIVLWCASHQLEGTFGDMGVIAIIPIVLFFGIGILTKEDFNNFPWTIIILAAGGLALGKAVKSSGLLHTIAGVVTKEVEGMSLYVVLVVFSSLILIIATFISHTVAALIILPLVYDVGMNMDEPHPNLLVMGGVLMCSAAMGLPTSGFPNMTAIMKEDPTGQRYLQVKHFISRGVPSSILTLIVVVSLGYGLMRVAGLD
ncbi:SPX domain-containing protein [Colletotrichum karsti]|uniref:SPX domain-containing protein n=1 Tax=Colletotrichum karsti TaxID=1095194 RepID=A0A9P6LMS6_9PEZI|nr:SPX domain-containing protein [Colletotrichum karsti]KAF9878491.1 SPX domain-containing protein [Colletotrichum karsti]